MLRRSVGDWDAMFSSGAACRCKQKRQLALTSLCVMWNWAIRSVGELMEPPPCLGIVTSRAGFEFLFCRLGGSFMVYICNYTLRLSVLEWRHSFFLCKPQISGNTLFADLQLMSCRQDSDTSVEIFNIGSVIHLKSWMIQRLRNYVHWEDWKTDDCRGVDCAPLGPFTPWIKELSLSTDVTPVSDRPPSRSTSLALRCWKLNRSATRLCVFVDRQWLIFHVHLVYHWCSKQRSTHVGKKLVAPTLGSMYNH